MAPIQQIEGRPRRNGKRRSRVSRSTLPAILARQTFPPKTFASVFRLLGLFSSLIQDLVAYQYPPPTRDDDDDDDDDAVAADPMDPLAAEEADQPQAEPPLTDRRKRRRRAVAGKTSRPTRVRPSAARRPPRDMSPSPPPGPGPSQGGVDEAGIRHMPILEGGENEIKYVRFAPPT